MRQSGDRQPHEVINYERVDEEEQARARRGLTAAASAALGSVLLATLAVLGAVAAPAPNSPDAARQQQATVRAREIRYEIQRIDSAPSFTERDLQRRRQLARELTLLQR